MHARESEARLSREACSLPSLSQAASSSHELIVDRHRMRTLTKRLVRVRASPSMLLDELARSPLLN